MARASKVTSDPDRYLLVVFSGAWDPLLALDPRDPTVFTNDVLPETQIQTGYDILGIGSDPRIPTPEMTFGPYIGDLAQLSNQLVLVRGMSMSSVGHSSATKHALTARVPSGETVRGYSVSTLLSSVLGEHDDIPNLVIGSKSYNLYHPLWASGFQSADVDDFHAALSDGEVALSDAQQDALYQFFAREKSRTRSNQLQSMYANRDAAQLLLESGMSSLFDLNNPSLSHLRQHFGVDNGVTGAEAENALVAYQALTNEFSMCHISSCFRVRFSQWR